MNEDGWRLDSVDGVTVARCEEFCRLPGVAHAFSTRRDSTGDDFDLGTHEDRGALHSDRRGALLRAAGIAGESLLLRQVHGARVVVIDDTIVDGTPADGAVVLAASRGGRVPAVRTADCVAVLLADDQGRAVAAIHAGWRGTAAGIVRRAIEVLSGEGIAPGSIRAALGPAIRGCCYEVGSEVVEALGTIAVPCGDRFRIDLHQANREQLESAGLDPGRIHSAPWCTCCREDLFFSYRRDGAGTGRLMACIGRP